MRFVVDITPDESVGPTDPYERADALQDYLCKIESPDFIYSVDAVDPTEDDT